MENWLNCTWIAFELTSRLLHLHVLQKDLQNLHLKSHPHEVLNNRK